jgi:catechol 2,3-dioxygenase-like lactoylglutathione lyase family enzyme
VSTEALQGTRSASHLRRAARLGVALLVALWLPVTAPARSAPATATAPRLAERPLVDAVDAVVIRVNDMDQALRFYTGVLTFRRIADREVAADAYEHLFGVFGMRARLVRLALGDEQVELMQFLAPRGRPMPVDSRSNDRWFQHIAIIVRDMGEAYARLRQFKVEHASSGPQKLPDWNPNAGGIEAFYFRDPDGNYLEILHFPRGKGAAKWQDRDRLFLGIDHTAIVVADTDASVAFYRDVLGLAVAGASENYGVEQEHLNNVFGAHLRITALRAAKGPGIELLEYLAPRTGRPMPPDTLASDSWYWQINLQTPDSRSAAAAALAAKAPYVSSGATTTPGRELGFASGVIVRDPDGHASLLFSAR